MKNNITLVVILSFIAIEFADAFDNFGSKNEQVEKMLPFRETNLTRLAEDEAENWGKKILNDSCTMPKQAKYVFLPRQGKATEDMLRTRYVIGDDIVTVTQSRSALLIVLKKNGISEGLQKKARELLIAEALCQIFRNAEEVEIKTIVVEKGRSMGVTVRSGTGLPPYASYKKYGEILESMESPWLHGMSWWCESDEIRFYLGKRTATPGSRLFSNPASEIDWFSSGRDAVDPERRRKLMEQLRKEKDPEKRRQLREEYLRAKGNPE